MVQQHASPQPNGRSSHRFLTRVSQSLSHRSSPPTIQSERTHNHHHRRYDSQNNENNQHYATSGSASSTYTTHHYSSTMGQPTPHTSSHSSSSAMDIDEEMRELPTTSSSTQHTVIDEQVSEMYESRGIPDDNFQFHPHDKIPLVINTRTFAPSDPNKIKGIYGHCMCIRYETNTLYVYGGWVQNSSRTDALLSLDLNQLDQKHRCCCNKDPNACELSDNTLEWKIVEQQGLVKPGPCSFASLVELNGCLILFGGYFHNSWVNDMWSFDLDTEMWTKVEYKGDQLIPPRAAHSCTLTRNKTSMIVHAGFDGTKVLNDLWIFSFITHEWKELQNYNPLCQIEPTTCHSSVMSYDEERLVKFGGWDRTQYFSYLYEYNFKRNEWTEVKPKNTDCNPPQRWSHTSVMVKSMTDLEDRLMVMLGSAQNYFSDCHIFDFGTKTWTEAQFNPPLEAQNSMTSVLTWNSRILLFGGRRKTEYINSLTELTVQNVAPMSMFFHQMISRAAFNELRIKKFASDIDIICHS